MSNSIQELSSFRAFLICHTLNSVEAVNVNYINNKVYFTVVGSNWVVDEGMNIRASMVCMERLVSYAELVDDVVAYHHTCH